jgi:tetratricopeptide (TPR) repeat protein
MILDLFLNTPILSCNMLNLKSKITKPAKLFTIAFISASFAILGLLPSIAEAETVVWTATFDYKFTHGETEQQARIVSMARIRQALLNAAGKTIQATAAFKAAPPMPDRAIILAAGVMKFNTKSMSLQKTTNGYSASLKVAGSIDKDTLSSDLNKFIANRFLFDNAQANQILSKKLLERLEGINQELGVKAVKANTRKTLRANRAYIIKRLSALAVMDAMISAGYSAQAHDPATIIKELNQAMTMDDSNAWLYLYRGRVYLDLTDWVAAYQDFIRAAQLDTHIIHAYNLKGDALIGIGDKQAAIAAYTTAIDLYLANKAPLLKRGRLFLEAGKYRLAQKDFSQVIELDPRNPEAFIARGETFMNAKQLLEAIADFTTALELRPDDATIYAKRGHAQVDSGLIDAGCNDWLVACELNFCRPLANAVASDICRSQDSGLFAKWAQTAYQAVTANSWQRAIQAATLAIYYDPQAVDPYINRAWAYAETNLFEEALQDIDRAIKMAPGNLAALNNQGLIYEMQGEWDKAAKSFFKACERGMELSCKNYLNASKAKPEKRISREERLLQQSVRHYRQKNWDLVVRLTSQIIQGKSPNARAYTLRAAARAQQRQFEDSIADCVAAIKIDPSYGLAYNNRGYVLESMGIKAEALVDYRVGCLLNSDLACQNYDRLNSKTPN